MKIGSVVVAAPVVLAPMEEHTNWCFRVLAKRCGAALVASERVDAMALARRDRRSLRLLHTTPDESPRSGQISGADPATMAEAARVVEELGFDLVDLNFECPIRRLVGRGEGGALMSDPPAIAALVTAVRRAVNIPVTLKIRSGPSADCLNAAEVAARAADAGAAAVTVHARTVAQAYQGGPDWSIIEPVKRAVAMPVLASGGIRQPCDAVALLRQTGADAVAVGRGALGNPWIFGQIRGLLSGGSVREPSMGERGRALVQLAECEHRFYGATVALRRLPRMACNFAKSLPDFAGFRDRVHAVRALPDFRRLVRETFG